MKNVIYFIIIIRGVYENSKPIFEQIMGVRKNQSHPQAILRCKKMEAKEEQKAEREENRTETIQKLR